MITGYTQSNLNFARLPEQFALASNCNPVAGSLAWKKVEKWHAQKKLKNSKKEVRKWKEQMCQIKENQSGTYIGAGADITSKHAMVAWAYRCASLRSWIKEELDIRRAARRRHICEIGFVTTKQILDTARMRLSVMWRSLPHRPDATPALQEPGTQDRGMRGLIQLQRIARILAKAVYDKW